MGHQPKYYEVKDQRYLGEDDFVDRIERKKASGNPCLFEIPIEEIALEVIRRLGIPRDRLYSLTRDRKGAHGRGLVAYLARKLTGSFVKEIAQHFQREPMTMSEAVIRIENRLLKDKELAGRVEEVEIHLRKGRKKKYLITLA